MILRKKSWELTAKQDNAQGMMFHKSLFVFFLLLIFTLIAGSQAFAAVYEVGPGKTYTRIIDVPTHQLSAGDIVKVYYKSTPYREKFLLHGVGTAEQPITLQGIPDSLGNMPVLEGKDAISRTEEGNYYWNEDRQVILVGQYSEKRSDHIIIDGFVVRNANSHNRFSNDNGEVQSYDQNASGVRVEYAGHVTVRNCEIYGNGNGVFSNNTDDLTIEHSYIHNNGASSSSSSKEHNLYLGGGSGSRVTIQYSRFGELDNDGQQCKFRTETVIFRYNWVDGGRNSQLDLVEDSRNGTSNAYVYGNVLIKPEATSNGRMIHFGGDSSSTPRAGTLYFFNNTCIIRSGRTAYVFKISKTDADVVADNNIFFKESSSSVVLWAGYENITGNHNWLSEGSSSTDVFENSLIGSDPGFTDIGTEDYALTDNAVCLNVVDEFSPPAGYTLEQQYVKHLNFEPRPSDGHLDIGAFERASSHQTTYILSGHVNTNAGDGVAGVILQGLPGNSVTDANGAYSAEVDEDWSGTVTPQHTEYQFTPVTRSYTNVAQNLTQEDYEAAPILRTYLLSGRVTTDAGNGVAGVVMQGLPGNPITDANGAYSAEVDAGWSGTVTPQHTAYQFAPVFLPYTNVAKDLGNQDYTALPNTYLISGRVSDGNGTPLVEVVLTGLPGETRTNENGEYSAEVPSGWSGTALPQKAEYTFAPEERTYHDVSADLTTQDYVGTTRASYFGFDEFGGTWQDASQASTEDMAWAAAAANILDWANWDTSIHGTAQEIFEHFEQSWPDAGESVETGWTWWINGLEAVDGGDFWSQYQFGDFFAEDQANTSGGQWNQGSHLMQSIDEYLHSGYGVTVGAYGTETAHEIAVWGYEYDETGTYTGLWVTDSQDALDSMLLLSVEQVGDLWFLDPEDLYGYKDWFIGSVQALDPRPVTTQAPVPEPGTVVLLGLGLLGVAALKRKSFKK